KSAAVLAIVKGKSLRDGLRPPLTAAARSGQRKLGWDEEMVAVRSNKEMVKNSSLDTNRPIQVTDWAIENVVSSLHCMNDPQAEGHMASHIGRRKVLATLGRLAACGNLGVAKTPVSHREECTHMNRKSFLVGLLAAGCFVATSTLMTSPGNAQADPKV